MRPPTLDCAVQSPGRSPRPRQSIVVTQHTGGGRAKAGTPKIEVNFSIDRDGMLSISASDTQSGRVSSVTIRGTQQLEQAEVDSWANDLKQLARANEAHEEL